MELINWAWNSPHFILWVSPSLFAVAVLFDNDFIGSGIYRSRFDGVVISALFGGVAPLILLAPQIDYQQLIAVPPGVILIAVTGALLYVAHLYFYFDVLFTLDLHGKPINDGASVELFINLNVLFVPLCAWLIFGQHLSFIQWAGVIVILFGALLMTGISCIRQTVTSGVLTALVLAGYYLCEDYVYNYTSLKNGFYIFSIALTAVGTVMVISPGTRPQKTIFSHKNLRRFLLAEAVAILAIITSQQALKLNQVVYVVAIESFTPIFVALLSVIPSAYLYYALNVDSQEKQSLRRSLATFSAQRASLAMKSCSALIMVGGTILLLS